MTTIDSTAAPSYAATGNFNSAYFFIGPHDVADTQVNSVQWVQEALIWTAPLSSTDRSAAHSNMKAYWGTP